MGTEFGRVLRNRQFLWFLGSFSTASTGYSVFAISIVWLAYQQFHSFLVVGAVLAVERGAYCVTFLVAPFADRVRNQRSIYVVSYPLQAAAAVALGYGALTGTLTVGLLLGLVVALSFLWDLTWAAGNAAPGILLTPDQQFAAGGVEGLLGGVNSIAGYAAGGALILVVGTGGGLYLYAALLLLATALALPLRIAPARESAGSFVESFRDGWGVLAAGPGHPLLQLGAVDAIQGFFSAAPVLLLALAAVRSFAGQASAYAVLFVAYVVGGVVAGLVFARWNPRHRVGGLLLASLGTGAAAFLVVSIEPALLAGTAAIWFLVGFVLSGYLDAKYAFLRGSVPPDRLARIVSNLYVFPGVTSTVGAVVVGAAATSLSFPALAWVVAGGLALAAVAGALLPGVRRLRF